MHTLEVTSGPARGQSLTVEGEVVIGREGADLTIEDSELSRRHVALRPVAGGVEVEDLGSLNGTVVDGRRISSPVTVTQPARITVGTSELRLEVTRPEPASPQVTAPRQVVSPDVTAPRQVVAPDVTAPRDVPSPDVTAPRDVPSPDVTAPRAVPSPDVTAPRAVAAPDVTAPRQTVPPPAPPASSGRSADGPPSTPAEGGTPGARPGGPPLGAILGGLAALAALALIVLFTLAARGEDSETHRMDVTVRTTELYFIPPRVGFSGTIEGRPVGKGTITQDQTFGGPPQDILKGPTPVFAKLVGRFPKGTLAGTLRATATPTAQGGTRLTGRVTWTHGTGEFENPSGTARVTGGRPNIRVPIASFVLKGDIEY